MSDDNNEPDYEIGYCRPPLHGRFRPGQSGNPKGRRTGSKNILTDLSEELNERIPVREGGRSRKLTKQRIVVKSLVAKAAKGDARAINAMMTLLSRILTADGPDAKGKTLSTEEQDLLDLLAGRAARTMPVRSGEDSEKQDPKKGAR